MSSHSGGEASAVHILVATCEGAAFLDAQLSSIRAQTETNWIALISDDASTDGTMAIILRHAAEDCRIVVLPPFLARRGVRANFSRLMQTALARDAGMFAFCDQDDLWHPEKIAQLRAALASAMYLAPTQPVLVYSDLSLIDRHGVLLADSHFEHAGASEARRGVGAWLLAHNVVPGCAMSGNRALLEKVYPIPDRVVHHDWWVLLVAAATGRVIAVDSVLTAYRQHGANAIGAMGPWRSIRRFFAAFPSQLGAARRQYALAIAQAEALISLADTEQEGNQAFLDWARRVRDELGASSPIRRVSAAMNGPVRRIGFARNVLFVAMAALPLDRECVYRT